MEKELSKMSSAAALNENEKANQEGVRIPRMMMQDNTHRGKPLPVDIDVVIDYCQGEKIHEIVREVREAASRGDTEGKRKAKNKAAVVVPMACNMRNDGKRKKENATPGGLNVCDFDDVEKPYDIYTQQIKGREKETGIVWVHCTISGHGLHIYFLRKKGESIGAGQKRIVEALGLDQYYDAKCTDGGRCAYLSVWEDTYYIDKESFEFALTEENKQTVVEWLEIDQAESRAVKNPQPSKKETTTNNMNNKENRENKKKLYTIMQNNIIGGGNSPVVYSATQTWPSTYNGIEYQTIIDSYLRCMDGEGTIKEGERNNKYFMLACGMKYVLPQGEGLLSVLPDCGLSEEERRVCINSALNYGIDDTKMPRSFRLVLQTLKAERKNEESTSAQEEVADEFTEEVSAGVRPEYALPAQVELLLRNLPDIFTEPVLFSLFPAWGTLCTGLRFKYNGKTQSFSFLSLCVGDPASGKGNIMDAVDAVIAPLREQTELYYAAQKKYEKELKIYMATGGTCAAPTEPEGCIRVVSGRTSLGKLLQYIDAADGAHILQLSREFRVYIDSIKKDWGPSVQLYNHSFHNEYDGSDYMSKDSYTGQVRVYLNGSYTGTKDCTLWLSDNHHTGVDTRFLVSSLPKEFAQEALEVEEYSEDEMAKISAISRQMIVKEGQIYCPWIDKAAKAWREEKRETALATGSKVIDYFMNRDADLFARMGYMLSVMYGCELHSIDEQASNDDKEKAATAWARYLTDYLLYQQFVYFGNSIENSKEITYKVPKIPHVYNALPEEFTTAEFRAVCEKYGSSYKDNTKTGIDSWILDGWCVKLGYGKYKKIKKNA